MLFTTSLSFSLILFFLLTNGTIISWLWTEWKLYSVCCMLYAVCELSLSYYVIQILLLLLLLLSVWFVIKWLSLIGQLCNTAAATAALAAAAHLPAAKMKCTKQTCHPSAWTKRRTKTKTIKSDTRSWRHSWRLDDQQILLIGSACCSSASVATTLAVDVFVTTTLTLHTHTQTHTHQHANTQWDNNFIKIPTKNDKILLNSFFSLSL